MITLGLIFAVGGSVPESFGSSSTDEGIVTASISGPGSVRPDSFCAWMADVSGGTPPYTYEWTKNGQSVGGNSQWVNIYANSQTDIPGFRIGLLVTDDLGSQDYVERVISMSSSAPLCMS